jgi:hypothetical protein
MTNRTLLLFYRFFFIQSDFLMSSREINFRKQKIVLTILL